MVVDIESQYALDRLLWYVRGHTTGNVYIDAVKVRHYPDCQPAVWGYSVYRRSPGFRTIGGSPRYHQVEYGFDVSALFDNREEAIRYYKSVRPVDKRSIEEISEEITPQMKFLKKCGIQHNLTEII